MVKSKTIVVSGLKDMDAGFSDGFDFTIMDLDEGITTKTYLNPVDRGNLNYELTSNFYNTSENLYFSSVYYDPEEFKITITNLNANYVEGTFSGKMKNLENQEIIDITDGRFFAPTRF
ncbi:hypothetical protein A9996_18670 [Gelidibacter algens]|uniref:hypothetical protein n=1 Tax=Gelidibacter algens TaxID=49280 RepID=UPI00080593D4|nr:hypothetical protein [Gelidibacter algens]OBX20979.1 hypothetical protein A9996_18670 [Gelidibacter algens]